VSRPRPDEGGFAILWILGLTLVVMALGGVSVDLWRGFTERRSIAEIADAAAHAGASGIDEGVYRDTGQVVLDAGPNGRAVQLAQQNLASQADKRSLTAWSVSATPQQVTVQVAGDVHLSLLGIFTGDQHLPLHVTAVAEPRASP
jgi:Flp pilus assembly protein TadG